MSSSAGLALRATPRRNGRSSDCAREGEQSFLRNVSPGPAIGQAERVPAAQAALVNGTLAHSLDFDDTHLPSVLHSSAAVVPTAPAAAERSGANGRVLIAAVAVGLDVVWGWAAHAAVTAAELVARGLTGPPSALEDRFGFFQAFLDGRYDATAIAKGLGEQWSVPGFGNGPELHLAGCDMTIKAPVGYDVVAGLTREEYDRWLWDIHVPDLLANPHLDRIVFNTVIEPVSTTSGTTVPIEQQMSLYRVAELHFADEDALACYRHWFQDHPIPTEPSPQGRSDFRFYVICESVQVTREGSE